MSALIAFLDFTIYCFCGGVGEEGKAEKLKSTTSELHGVFGNQISFQHQYGNGGETETIIDLFFEFDLNHSDTEMLCIVITSEWGGIVDGVLLTSTPFKYCADAFTGMAD